MRLRIIAGERGGRFIQVPPGARPTPERVREAWFAALGERVRGARVVDLFAGSGALGIEALSRGAEHAHFVESARRAAGVIRENLEFLGLTERGTVVQRDVFAFLESPGADGFDLALADPPYAGDASERLLRRFRAGAFAPLLCVEHRAGADLAEAWWSRRYGDTRVSCFTSDSLPDRTEP